MTPGELLAGKYRVERVIGEGGMGVVLAARNEALGQRVALKVLRRGALEDGEAIKRFAREARAAASLRSEHVARVLDVGDLGDGRPYMVLELLEGHDLGDIIDKTPALAVHEAVDYVLQACEAIAEAHSAGIIHRDLKPKNLFLTAAVHGRPLVKVLDFGISKVEGPAHEMQLTRTTEVIGSPSYMSPEQLRSARNVDPRTDIWALGVILYELLTKRLPFYAHTVTELVAVVLLEREPPVHLLRPDVPEALSHAIGRCLAKRPEDRFATVLDLAHALAPFANGMSISAVERIRGVSLQSGKTLPTNNGGPVPPGASSSSRVNVHGGTSVAWGETQVEKVPPTQPSARASRSTVLTFALAGVLLASGLGGGALYWASRRAEATTAHGPPAATDIPLPPRKDLPPLAQTPAPEPSTVPSELPDNRLPVIKPAPTLATAQPPSPTASATARIVRPAAPRPDPAGRPGEKGGDDLSNIGRR